MIEILRLDTEIAGTKATRLIALVGGEFIGSVDLEFKNRRVAQFARLFIKADRRGCGWGSQLVEMCITLAQGQGCESISATLDPGNHEVLPFYQRLGFILACEWGDDGLLLISKSLAVEIDLVAQRRARE